MNRPTPMNTSAKHCADRLGELQEIALSGGMTGFAILFEDGTCEIQRELHGEFTDGYTMVGHLHRVMIDFLQLEEPPEDEE